MYRNSACGAGSMGSIARVAVGSQSNAASARARRNLVAPLFFVRIEACFHAGVSRCQRFQSVAKPEVH